MPRRSADTRAEIREVATELFAAQGIEQTSLREIAERLDITKAALYYHFPSKDELIAELVRPMVADIEAFHTDVTSTAPGDLRPLLGRYLDLCHRHRLLFQGLLRDIAVLGRLDVLSTVLEKRAEVDRVLVGGDAPADRVRAVIALGGLQDCVVLMADEPLESYREAAVDSALRALRPA
ncbi:TetR/AcrR family transcriptional regulator [Pseudonocardia xinjiangensis]|uniref:TetR/AcrR family transcriptional regulator n=1 Tax=Pseudonocardia xinjiangensis TaxID=75289 RepID=UPI003D8D7FCD